MKEYIGAALKRLRKSLAALTCRAPASVRPSMSRLIFIPSCCPVYLSQICLFSLAVVLNLSLDMLHTI